MRAVALTLLLCLAVGCGAEVSIGGGDAASGREVAEDVRAEYERQTSIKLERLTCEEAEARVGAPVSCSGTNANDVELTIGGEVTRAEGSKIEFRWSVTEARAPGEVYAAEAQRQLEQRVGQPARDLTCPARILVRAGERVRCELETLDGLTYGVTLELTDADGGFDARVDDRPADGTGVSSGS